MNAKVDKAKIDEELAKIVDPEIGIPITKMKLVDRVEIDNGNVSIDFHLTMPFCPPMFAIKIAKDIKNNVSKLKGVESVKVTLKNHQMADQINALVNR